MQECKEEGFLEMVQKTDLDLLIVLVAFLDLILPSSNLQSWACALGPPGCIIRPVLA